ncbi:hypothetical protein [Chromohalobacter israelensis]|uniref:hypothetical protein n=1 Tax=Chromohalobacter israelensis TaxID=141390 RepID=UPI00265CB7E4|nr:hypothetical protein [Chromohalobacter salexigens]
MPREMTLREFVAETSQDAVATMMGVTQGAVSQMLRSKRDIRVIALDPPDSGYRFIEIKSLGRSHAA